MGKSSTEGLDGRSRHLVTISLHGAVGDEEGLRTAIDEALGCRSQLEAHRRGARNAGATDEEIAQAVELAAPQKRIGRERSQDAEEGQ